MTTDLSSELLSFFKLIFGDHFDGSQIVTDSDLDWALKPFLFILDLTSGVRFHSAEATQFRSARICSAEEAGLLFKSILFRVGGTERERLSVQQIVNELVGSEEFGIQVRAERQEITVRVWAEMAAVGGKFPEWYVSSNLESKFPLYIFVQKPDGNTAVLYDAYVVLGDPCSITLRFGLPDIFINRLRSFIVLLEKFERLYTSQKSGSFHVSLSDDGSSESALVFSSSHPQACLIPDSNFINRRGYNTERILYPRHNVPWRERLNKAYWRGTDTGAYRYKSRLSAPRVAICLLSHRYGGKLDAAITGIQSIGDAAEIKQEYERLRVLSAHAPQDEILAYKYQVDIDGNTNSWDGAFLKLLSGSPVLKVKSEFGFRQWYYNRLVPWVNFVPIASDLSDLMKNIDFLEAHPVLAESIGRKGQELALSLTYDDQLDDGCATMLKLLLGI